MKKIIHRAEDLFSSGTGIHSAWSSGRWIIFFARCSLIRTPFRKSYVPPSSYPPARRASWPNGEWGYSTRRHMLEPLRPEAVFPDRALRLPTFRHFLIVNKTALSPSLPLKKKRCRVFFCKVTVALALCNGVLRCRQHMLRQYLCRISSSSSWPQRCLLLEACRSCWYSSFLNIARYSSSLTGDDKRETCFSSPVKNQY
jgi:hypothetical protein